MCMYCFGLGVDKNLDIAHRYLVSSAIQDDALEKRWGFVHFHGTAIQAQNLKLAFHHVNELAHGGSAEGMSNLASPRLTGAGTDQHCLTGACLTGPPPVP